jgi:predicted thioesterase
MMNVRSPRLRGVAGLFTLVFLAGACDGANLFEGEVAEAAPEVTVFAPSSVDAGDSFNVQVTGTSPRGVSFIEVRLAGAAQDTVREEFSGTSMSESMSVSVTPSSALGSQVTVTAYVQDVNGRNSPFQSRTVAVNVITGPPGSD